MITISFRRKSVCMGDDAGNGEYIIQMDDDASVSDLMEILLHGGNGNDWPIPYTGANSYWVIKSNIGDLGNINTDSDGEWYIEYTSCSPDALLKDLGIEWVFGEH